MATGIDLVQAAAWHEYFESKGLDVFNVIENAIVVAAWYRPGEFLERRPQLADILFAKKDPLPRSRIGGSEKDHHGSEPTNAQHKQDSRRASSDESTDESPTVSWPPAHVVSKPSRAGKLVFRVSATEHLTTKASNPFVRAPSPTKKAKPTREHLYKEGLDDLIRERKTGLVLGLKAYSTKQSGSKQVKGSYQARKVTPPGCNTELELKGTSKKTIQDGECKLTPAGSNKVEAAKPDDAPIKMKQRNCQDLGHEVNKVLETKCQDEASTHIELDANNADRSQEGNYKTQKITMGSSKKVEVSKLDDAAIVMQTLENTIRFQERNHQPRNITRGSSKVDRTKVDKASMETKGVSTKRKLQEGYKHAQHIKRIKTTQFTDIPRAQVAGLS